MATAAPDRTPMPHRVIVTEIRVADTDHLIIESADLLAILRDAPADAVAA